MKQLSKLLCFTLLLFTYTQQAFAQSATASSLVDTVAGSAPGPVNSVNCDMVQCPSFSSNFLKAVVWSEITTGGNFTSLFVEYNGTQIGTIQIIPNGVFADVVLGDNMNNPCNEYTVAVVFMIYGNPTHTTYIQTYNVDLTGLTITPNPFGPVQLSNPTASVKYAHIDLLADNATQIGGLPSLHKYVACWEGNIYNAVVGDINNITGPVNTFLAAGGATSDVAAYSDGPNDYACFVYSGTSSGVDEWDITTTPTYNATPLSSLGGEAPRIEAMSLYGGSSNAKFMAVAYENMGTGSRVNYASDLATGSTFTGTYTPITSTPIAPVVAAGLGAGGSSTLIGNSQYSYSFNYVFTPNDIWAQDLNITTGLPTSTLAFQEVNNSSTPSIGGGGPYAAHALSSSSNSGYGLLSAYWDGSDIYYKVSSTTTFGFKTNSINRIDTKTGFSVYPNPATDYLNINAPSDYKFTITDVAGKAYIQATSTGKPVDIKQLPAGFYIIDVHNDTDRRVLKFTKQ